MRPGGALAFLFASAGGDALGLNVGEVAVLLLCFAGSDGGDARSASATDGGGARRVGSIRGCAETDGVGSIEVSTLRQCSKKSSTFGGTRSSSVLAPLSFLFFEWQGSQ